MATSGGTHTLSPPQTFSGPFTCSGNKLTIDQDGGRLTFTRT
jgi:hypothetical protein